MNKTVLFAVLFCLLAPQAWAETVRNNTTSAVTFEAPGGKWIILPGESAELDQMVFLHPVVQRLIDSGKLTHETELTVEFCNSEEADEYCFMDLAVQEQSAIYCAYHEHWSSARECLYYVNRDRAAKLTEDDCLGFDPGSYNREQCIEYVRSGIPSVPGQPYEQTLSSD